ncbi:Hsp70 family protein, partial [bacterium]|nr:Hsp70 family protein [bacterium]
MRKESAFYIDLGTTNTLIHSKSKGFTIGEPTLLAEKKRSSHKSECIAFGFAARSMLGKTPSSSFVLRPLQEGVISDFRSAASLLHLLKKRVQDHALWLQPRILISLPYLVNHHERAAVREVSHDLGARRTHLISEPLLAALGSGLNVLGPRGSMIVDIGGGTSEAAIVSLGGIVVANAVRMGGHSLDSSI